MKRAVEADFEHVRLAVVYAKHVGKPDEFFHANALRTHAFIVADCHREAMNGF